VDWQGWATFGFGATVALTAVLVAAQFGGLTRMDIPMMLGTVFVEDPDKARVVGFFVHLINGQGLCPFYMRPSSRLSMRQVGGSGHCSEDYMALLL
jgi:hypothetical protein